MNQNPIQLMCVVLSGCQRKKSNWACFVFYFNLIFCHKGTLYCTRFPFNCNNHWSCVTKTFNTTIFIFTGFASFKHEDCIEMCVAKGNDVNEALTHRGNNILRSSKKEIDVLIFNLLYVYECTCTHQLTKSVSLLLLIFIFSFMVCSVNAPHLL